MDRIKNTLETLTAEDKFLIELLVDGELDEPRRRNLLVQLDQIEGGWRFCAITFLESQCLQHTYHAARAVCTSASPSLHSSHEIREQIPSSTRQRDEISACPPIALGSTAVAPGFEQVLSDVNCGRRSAGEPTIIPLKKGGYHPGRSLFSSGGSGGGGTSWPAVITAMAGGFLLAFVLTGLLAFLGSSSSNSDLPVTLPGETGIPFAKSDPAGGVQNGANANQENLPIHLVTLKSPDKNLNGISVPCVEASAYPSDSLRHFRKHDTADRYVEGLKKNGHKVETIYEELAFPLEDGRTLILPVDTFNVQYQTPSLQNFQ